MSQISIDRVHATAKKHKKIVILTRHTLFTHKSSRIIRKTGATGTRLKPLLDGYGIQAPRLSS